MSEEDFIVGYTLFKSGGFRTKYQHFNNLETAKIFTSNVNLKDNSKIYVPLDLYNKQKEEIEELKFKYIARKDRTIQEIEYYKDELEKESSIWTKIEKGNNYISKNKIRDLIKELEEKEKNCNFTGLITECEIKIETLKELLEEK